MDETSGGGDDGKYEFLAIKQTLTSPQRSTNLPFCVTECSNKQIAQ